MSSMYETSMEGYRRSKAVSIILIGIILVITGLTMPIFIGVPWDASTILWTVAFQMFVILMFIIPLIFIAQRVNRASLEQLALSPMEASYTGQEKMCPVCGRRVPHYAIYCPFCGERIGQEEDRQDFF